jgi:succinoglycan biosynthesis protein ExoM
MIVDVCVCTFQRASLWDTLRSLASQVLPPEVVSRVIIADNDTTPSAYPVVLRAAAELGLRCEYRHAPARNISIARNACLDAASAPFVAFLDDDEVADPNWLANLLSALQSGEGDVVFGPVQACYGANLPAWTQRADLHSIRPVIRAGGRIETGYTSNVIMRHSVIGQHRFDPALGRSGGEDTQFFAALHAMGARLRYAPSAIVYEDVPAARARLRWLLRRAFRSGQVHGRIQAARTARTLAPASVAASKALYCAAGAALRLASPAGWRRYLVRASLHAGVVARLLGAKELQLY